VFRETDRSIIGKCAGGLARESPLPLERTEAIVASIELVPGGDDFGIGHYQDRSQAAAEGGHQQRCSEEGCYVCGREYDGRDRWRSIAPAQEDSGHADDQDDQQHAGGNEENREDDHSGQRVPLLSDHRQQSAQPETDEPGRRPQPER
jgi:hypothetical protein